MLIIRRKFVIGAHPNEEDIIVNKLEELGCVIPDIKYHETQVCGRDIAKVFIKDTIDADKLDELIKWLQTEIKSVVSITY